MIKLVARWFIGLTGMFGAILACNAMEPNVVASQWLTHLRDGTSQYDSFIGYVREEVRKGDLTLADVGTSEEELASFRFASK